jgi:hypothetical protein
MTGPAAGPVLMSVYAGGPAFVKNDPSGQKTL